MSLREKLTLWHLKFTEKRFVEKQTLHYPKGTINEAFIYMADDGNLGQITLFGTMILNLRLFEYSELAQEYVVFHEQGHQKMHWLAKLVIYPLIVIFAMIALCSGIFTAIFLALTPLHWIFHAQIDPLSLAFQFALTTLACTIGYSFFQFISEGYADYNALRKIGVDQFRTAYSEIKQKPKFKIRKRDILIAKLTYPPRPWTIWLYEKRHPKPDLVKMAKQRKEIAKLNMEKYPEIVAAFGRDWLETEIARLTIKPDGDLDCHGLIWLLSNLSQPPQEKNLLEQIEKNSQMKKENVDLGFMTYLQYGHLSGLLLPSNKLAELEENIRLLKAMPRFTQLIGNAKNEPQFWGTMSEIEIAGALKKTDRLLEIQPSINAKTPDLLVQIGDQTYCLEVYTPMRSQAMEELHRRGGGAAFLENRAFDKLRDKLAQMPDNHQSILIINHSFSEMDAIHIMDAFLGTAGIKIPLDYTQEPQEYRSPDGLIWSSNMKKLSGVIIYKRLNDYHQGLTLTECAIKPVQENDTIKLTEEQLRQLHETMNQLNYKPKKPTPAPSSDA